MNMMYKNSLMKCPRTPAPMRNSSFLMSAAAILETPTLLKKTPTISANTNNRSNVSHLQTPSAAPKAAMQLLMFNQMQTSAAISGSGESPFSHTSFEKFNFSSSDGFNFATSNVPRAYTNHPTIAARHPPNFSNENLNKRKLEERFSQAGRQAKRVSFDMFPLKPNKSLNANRRLSRVSQAIRSSSSMTTKHTQSELTKSVPKRLRILTGTVENVLKLTKTAPEGSSPLVEVFAMVLNIKSGTYECEKVLLLRNKTGPIMQGVFYEIDFRMELISVGDLVRCVGRLTGGSRLQILKIAQATPEEERMAQRLQTVSGFVLAIKR
ncbi:uncharacterized protein LOC129764499 isoform X2 [Toxorhynchites rutilus septentrionalis]|uniref:uncharacterized protein LOC129764499 isoform X2 n=1 Tax=Toxorhynchites rutilus septentrionalis TaxID=329112 RepID=UPI00247A2871|nr:uncharacterized protein LOC129764499 isoform X2 [Toxorhynchites rutilus septentrionalis]